MMKKIKNALISVYNKEEILPVLQKLEELDINIYSTGGTHKYIFSQGFRSVAIEEITGYPSILGGRVKTLHPKVFGGILSRRSNKSDLIEIEKYKIPKIDLVIVDLYPFEETLAISNNEDEIIEKIDIGGISLIRAAAKNYKDVVIIPSKKYYNYLLKLLQEKKGFTSIEDRHYLASNAFLISSHYDTEIFNYFNKKENINVFIKNIFSYKKLRYGENPHQKAIYYGDFDKYFEQLNGKELSYNNLLDIDAAISLISDFKNEENIIAIFKHCNPCGVASRKNIIDAWNDALAGDPVSAFGGVIICNSNVNFELAKKIDSIFYEILIMPSIDKDALNLLKKKKKRIILKYKENNISNKQFRTAAYGILEQEKDNKTEAFNDLKTVTNKKVSKKDKENLIFANKIVKQLKSNAIVIVKNKQLIGSGMGQPSRVDALKQAINKAKTFAFDLKDSVMASDAFFPFPDCVEIAAKEGIKSIIQPGGSIRDNKLIEACNKLGISMVFTGIRHFKH